MPRLNACFVIETTIKIYCSFIRAEKGFETKNVRRRLPKMFEPGGRIFKLNEKTFLINKFPLPVKFFTESRFKKVQLNFNWKSEKKTKFLCIRPLQTNDRSAAWIDPIRNTIFCGETDTTTRSARLKLTTPTDQQPGSDYQVKIINCT